MIDNLGIKRIDHVDFIVHDFERSVDFYGNKMDFRAIAKSNADSEAELGEQSVLYEAARARVQITAPLEGSSHAAKFLKNHPDGIRKVAFRVQDAAHAFRMVEERHANIVDEVRDQGDYKEFSIASPLGDVEYSFVEKADDATVDPTLSAFQDAPNKGQNHHGFTHMDHITSNTRDMRSLTNWYRDVLGFEHFWDIRFHTQDSNPDMETGSGLNSIVMRDPKANVKFATNEPLRPHFSSSQIQKYVNDNGGPGVQHIALSTAKIMDVIPDMRASGCKFLETPDAYYEMLPERMAEREVGEIKETIEELQERKILVDGGDNRYLLQIFMQEAALMYDEATAGPFFYEVIQRHGHQGFGEGNFRALFESIERQQDGETTRTLENPGLVD
jgi:4-hydroxyphenylpyruvate dioxygenase